MTLVLNTTLIDIVNNKTIGSTFKFPSNNNSYRINNFKIYSDEIFDGCFLFEMMKYDSWNSNANIIDEYNYRKQLQKENFQTSNDEQFTYMCIVEPIIQTMNIETEYMIMIPQISIDNIDNTTKLKFSIELEQI